MVSFSCEVCNDTVIKKKLQQHQRSCHGAYFTCIDCSTTFYGNDHQQHTSCISEAEKYEKGLYKGKKGNAQQKKQNQNQSQYQKPQLPKQQEPKKIDEPKKVEKPKKIQEPKEKSKNDTISKYIDSKETNLYKIFKSAKKDNKKFSDKTEFLKNVKVSQNQDGSYSISI